MVICSFRQGKAWSACRKYLSKGAAYSTLAPASSERVDVSCRSNGNITLDLFHPTSGSPLQKSPATVLLYLPRGPLLANPEQDAANIASLRTKLPFTIAQVNYRLNGTHRYPTPIHDVLAGYDWVQEHLLPRRAITRAGRPDHVGRVAVAGELIGGSLAIMLALTECRRGEPGITAAAINNPLADWVLPGEEEIPSPKASIVVNEQTHPGLTVTDMLEARDRLFTKPEAYFDPFASPILFFRTAGAEPPRPKSTVLDDLAELSLLDREDFYREQALLSGISQTSAAEAAAIKKSPLLAKKKASRLFPSKAFNLDLHSFYISAGNTSPLYDQAHELTQALRKSIIRQQRARSATSSFGRKLLIEGEEDQFDEEQRQQETAESAEADAKVAFESTQGMGLWGRSEIENAAAWLREKLS